MKKLFLTLIFCISFGFLNAQNLSALYNNCAFFIPNEGPYVETYLLFDASTLQFKQEAENKYKATIEITMELKRNDSVEFFNKYELNSPEISSLDNKYFSFLDIQRFAVRNGIYTLNLTLQDKNVEANKYSFSDKISVYFSENEISFSDIQFVSEYSPTKEENILSKNGFDIIPMVGSFYPQEINRLTYYCEIYNVSKVLPSITHYVLYSYVEVAETGFKFDFLQRMKREKVANTNPTLSSFDITDLPSGNYNLVLEIRDMENQTVAYAKQYFQRSNPGKGRAVDSLYSSGFNFTSLIQNDSLLLEYIQALDVIASSGEQIFIRNDAKLSTLKEKQEFFHRFWINRNYLDPELEWLEYKKLLDVVQNNFSTKRKAGYKTDRGRVYLKYGPPNYIIDEKFKTAIVSESDIYGNVKKQQLTYLPYQIWRYDLLQNNESNRRFVFWSPQSTTADYDLLHSNVTGELYDLYWEEKLSRGQLQKDEIGEAGRQFERGYY